MRRTPDTAPSLRFSPTHASRFTHGVVCLASLLAGAGLVSMAAPRTWLVAGSQDRPANAGGMLLEFTAKWCGACQEMNPIVERLAQQGYPIQQVDADARRDLIDRYQITSLPTFVLVVDGREVLRQVGGTEESQLRRMLLQIPQWRDELAGADPNAGRSRELPKRTPVAEPDVASPFEQVVLGEARPMEQIADAAPPKRGFGLPFLSGRNKGTTKPAALSAEEPPVVRSQSEDPGTPRAFPTGHDPLHASTRLRVTDAQGVNYGAGTILECKMGRTLILTCGHLFRHLDDAGKVEVDLFTKDRAPVTYLGKVVHYDLVADVGLVAIPTTERLATTPIADLGHALSVGDSVVSIGCGGGEPPSRETVEVTAVNKYDGPDNIECTGFPIPGRSGGGLFRGQELVGICIAADPKDRRGVYTGLTPIYDLLEGAGFGHLLPVGKPQAAPAVVADATPTFPETTEDVPRQAGALPTDLELGAAVAEGLRDEPLATATTAADLQTVLTQSPDAEVICIVRPKNPEQASRVVIIHQATPKLASYLLDAVGEPISTQVSRQEPVSRDRGLIPTSGLEGSTPNWEPAAPVESTSRRKPLRPRSPR